MLSAPTTIVSQDDIKTKIGQIVGITSGGEQFPCCSWTAGSSTACGYILQEGWSKMKKSSTSFGSRGGDNNLSFGSLFQNGEVRNDRVAASQKSVCVSGGTQGISTQPGAWLHLNFIYVANMLTQSSSFMNTVSWK
jgi:hypothetical protein